MKKVLACILALVMCLGIFAGCNTQTPAPTSAPTQADPEPSLSSTDSSAEDLKSAAAYVKAIYKEAAVSTPTDYQRISVVRVGDVEYLVAWTADVGEDVVKAVPNGDGTVTIVIGTAIEGETPYVLTATVTNAEGASESVSFNYYIPAPLGSQTEIVDMAYELEVGATLEAPATLTGVITEIDTAYSAQYKNISVIMVIEGREDKPIMCYRLKGDGAEDLMPGDTITVTGNIKNYKGTIEFDQGCTLDKLVKGENSFVMPTDPVEIVDAAYSLGWNQSMPKAVTLTGKIVEIDSPYTSYYDNITVVMSVPGREWAHITCYRLKGADTHMLWIGDTITVTGVIKNYKGTIEFDQGCTLDSWVETGEYVPFFCTAAEAAVYANETLKNGEMLYGEYTMTGRVKTGGSNPTIELPELGSDLQIVCYKLNMDSRKMSAGDYVTVRGTFQKNSSGKLELNGYLCCVDRTTLAEAKEEAAALANKEYLFYETTATGTISGYKYNSKYNSATFTLTTADGTEIYCYSVPGYAADQLSDGEVVTVTGKLTAYNGTPQFDNTAKFEWRLKPDLPAADSELTAAQANEIGLAMGHNTYTEDKYYVTGVITSIPGTEYGNMYIKDAAGDDFYVYGLYTKDNVRFDKMNPQPAVGDAITVYGALGQYNGSPQMKNATLTSHIPGEGGSTETPDPDPNPGEGEDKPELTLTSGEYLLSTVYDGTTYYAGAFNSSKKGFVVETEKDSAVTYTVTVDKTAGTATIAFDSNYYGHTSGNALAQLTNAFSWNVTENEDGTYSFSFTHASDGERYMAYNNNVQDGVPSPVWRCYKQSSLGAAYSANFTLTAAEGGSTTPGESTIPATFAEQKAEAAQLTSGYLPYSSTFTGVVTGEVTEGTYNGKTNYTFTLDDGTDDIYCFQINVDDGVVIKTGDTVTITAKLTAYKGSPQFKYTPEALIVVPGEGGSTETPDPNPGEGEGEGGETGAYTMIDSVANLSAGTYYVSGYLTSYTNNGTTYDWAASPYHVWNGTINSSDCVTSTYSFADGNLTGEGAAEINLVAVEGKANTYYIMVGEQYLYSTSYANRKLALGDTQFEWVATNNANGGITLTTAMTDGTISIGTAGAQSKLIRSYKDESTLKYGLVFFKAN